MSEGLRKVKAMFKAPKMPTVAAPEQKVEKMPVIDDARNRQAALAGGAAIPRC